MTSNISLVRLAARSHVGLRESVASSAKMSLPRGIDAARARAKKSSSEELDVVEEGRESPAGGVHMHVFLQKSGFAGFR
jgi:hypothetical protein